MKVDANSQPRVLVVTSDPFWKHHRGSSQRILTMLDYLLTFCDVTICFVGELSIREWTEAKSVLPCQLVGPGEPGKVVASIVGAASKWLGSKDLHADKDSREPKSFRLEIFESELIAKYVAELAKDDFDWALLEYVSLSYLCPALREVGVDSIIDTHDAMSIRCQQFERVGLQSWLCVEADEELAALDRADIVLAIQRNEQDYFERGGLKNKVILATHASEFRGKVYSADSNDVFTVGFLGSNGAANLCDLSRWLAECWPIVRAQLPSARLLVAGSLSASDLSVNDFVGVEFLGKVPFLSDFYSKLDLAINPAQIASGMKIKSLEAIAHGVPLLTTHAGSAGLESAIGRCVTVVDDMHQFASSMLGLVEDEDRLQKMADECRVVIESQFHPDRVFGELKNRLLSKRS